MKSKIILVILILAFVSINVVLAEVIPGSQDASPKTYGVPLDGGLLSILGAAGVAYFVARRKKKNTDS